MMIWTPVPPYLAPITKAPLALVSSAFIHTAYTPPNPPADDTETAKYGKKDGLSLNFARTVGFATKTIFWIYSACEAATVIANEFPSETSSTVLSWLVRSGHSPSSIRVTTPWLVGWACLCIGPTIRWFAIRELGRFFTWDLSIKKDQHLVTTGPYSIVRHPAYFGNVFMLIGTFLSHIGPGSWYREAGWLDTLGGKALAALWFANIVWVPGTMLLSRVHTEDAILRQQWPEEWERWAKKTPYKVIPYIY